MAPQRAHKRRKQKRRPRRRKPLEYYPPNCKFRFYTNMNLLTTIANAIVEQGHLIPAFKEGQEAGEGDTQYQFTHILICKDKPLIIRSAFPDPPSASGPGVVIAKPKEQNNLFGVGSPYPTYWLVYEHTVNKGRPDVHRRAYLQRRTTEAV